MVRLMIVVLTGSAGPLGARVARALHEQLSDGQVIVANSPDDQALLVEQCDVVVDLGSSDYDRRAARRESVTGVAASTLFTADRLRASQVVFVSSALVY